MARTPASDGSAGVGKSGSPAPKSITSSPAALRRFASCEMAIVAEVSRWCRLGERPDPGVMGERIARTGKGTQPDAPPSLPFASPRATIPPDASPFDNRGSCDGRRREGRAGARPAGGVGTAAGGGAGAGSLGAAWSHDPGAAPRGEPSRAHRLCGRRGRGGLGRRGTEQPPHPRRHRPRAPVCRARFAVVPSFRRSIAVRDALDALTATMPFVWNGGSVAPPEPAPDAVLCTALPSRDEAAALARLGGGEPVVFITAVQLPYLRSVATLTPLALASGADRARDRAEALRERVTGLLTAGNVDAELALLDPLFERFDPAEVAGALLALLGDEGSGKGEGAAPPPSTGTERVKVFVNVGKKDRASAKDLVGALIREAGVAKGDIGRIEVRETFSLVEVATGAADKAVRGLGGATIRGRR